MNLIEIERKIWSKGNGRKEVLKKKISAERNRHIYNTIKCNYLPIIGRKGKSRRNVCKGHIAFVS